MKIAYDAKLKRPGCVIIQAAMGGTVHDFAFKFPSETWLLSPTPDMRLYEVTEEQLKMLAQMSEASVEAS